ncbi:MAG: hypothetical protein ACLVF9_06815 [Enterocloster sp.]
MLKLNFKDLLNQFHYVSIPIQMECIQQINCLTELADPVSFDVMWNKLLQILTPFIPEQIPFIESWKADIFMAIYSSVSYLTVEPMMISSINKNLSEIPSIPYSPESIDTIFRRSRTSLRNDLSVHILPNQNLSYFSDIWEKGSSANSRPPLKIFHFPDYFIYVKNFDKMPFSYENRNGMLLHQWYKDTKNIYDELYMYNSYFSDTDLQFRYYVFEQLLAPCRLTAILSCFWDLYSKNFSKTKKAFRERAILYTTTICNVPFLSIEVIGKELAPIIEQLLNMETEKGNDPELQEYLHNKIFQFICLPYVCFPLCQILLVTMMDGLYSPRYRENFLNHLQNDLSQYIGKNPTLFNYEENIKHAFQVFETLYYPTKSKRPLKQSSDNNVAITSFGYNFTYNCFLQDEEFSCYERARLQQKNSCILNRKTYISPVRDILFGVYKKLNDRVQITDSINTPNYLQALNPSTIVLFKP